MKFNIERLKEVARPASAEELKDAEYRKQNYDWLQKSALIALDIHTYLRKNNISKQEFAKMLDVTPAQVTKLLSGKENLGLKTISKIDSSSPPHHGACRSWAYKSCRRKSSP